MYAVHNLFSSIAIMAQADVQEETVFFNLSEVVRVIRNRDPSFSTNPEIS